TRCHGSSGAGATIRRGSRTGGPAMVGDDVMTTPAPALQRALRVGSLRREYRLPQGKKRVALDGLSLSVAPGGQGVPLGPNGSGRSTLLRVVCGMDAPDAGEVEMLGVGLSGRVSARAARGVRARLGVVFQEPGLDELLTVRENLLAQAALFGIIGEAAARRA